MTRRALPVLLLCAAALPAAAQTPDIATPRQLWDQGARAYQDLEYDSAAAWLRRGLTHPATAALPLAERLRALGYLGATEHFRGRRDSAVATFRDGLLLEPRFRLDQLIFPPDVLSLFEEVRLGFPVAAAAVPPRSELAGAGDRLVSRVYASTYHDIVVTLERDAGLPVRTLYTGAVGDSVQVLWDGRDGQNALVPAGRYTLRVVSRLAGAGAVRSVMVPLTVTHAPNDTLPWPAAPADSLLRPERTVGALNTGALAAGLGVAGLTMLLPSLVGGDDPAGTRLVVAGALSVTGVVGLLRGRRGRAIPENIALNNGIRAAWQARVDDIRRQNAQRRATARLIITAGPAVSGAAR